MVCDDSMEENPKTSRTKIESVDTVARLQL